MTRPALRLLVVLVALLAPGGLLASRLWSAPSARPVNLERLPEQLGSHRLIRRDVLERDVLELISPDSHVLRLYESGQGHQVWLYAGYYATQLQLAAHDPRVCYPAQGWDILASETVEIRLPTGEPLRARALTAGLDTRRQGVLYWFQPVGRWPRQGWLEELSRVLDAVRGTPAYTFVRLSTEMRGDPRQTRKILEKLARELAPHLRVLMDGG